MTKRDRTTVSAMLIGSLLAGTALPAIAQEDVSEAADTNSEARLGTVTVTAQKREESLQDVPISITAFTADTVEAAGSVNITGLNGLAPNVVLQTEGLIPNVPMTSIRGISQSDPDPNSDPKISTVIDGVYVPFVAGTMLDLFDVERVEILKGPQGTLFGKNNLGGTINVVTARPADEFGGKLRLTAGENGLLQGRAKIDTGRFANGTMAAKLAVNLRQYDGYSTNIVTGSDLNTNEVSAFRGALTYNPTDTIESTLIIDTLTDDTVGPAGNTVDNGDPRFQAIPQEARDSIRVSAVAFDPTANTETTGVAWETNWDTGAGTVTAVLGYRNLTYITRGDFDGLTVPEPGLDVMRDFESDAYSGELRYASPTGDVFDYVVGLYASYDEFQQDNTVFPAPPVLSTSTLRQEATSLAAFAQANWYFAEDWTLTVGGRYTEDEKDYFIDAELFVGGNFVPPSSFEDDLNASWSNFSPRAAIEYSPTDNLLYYGSISTGYKGGGFNSRGTLPQNVGPYDEETVTAYEIGLKSDLLDGTMRLNLAAFFNDYQDLQGAVTRQGAARAENVTSNVSDAETSGIELAWQWLPTDNLSLAFNFAYLDAQFTRFCEDVDGVFTDGSDEPGQCGPAVEVRDAAGNPTGTFEVPVDSTGLDLANAPPYSGSFIVDYMVPIQLGEIRFNGDLRYTDTYNTWGRSNNPAFYRDSVVLVNASVALVDHDDVWEVRLFGRNLTDEDVLSGAIAAGANPIVQFFQPPREVGVEVAFNF